MKRKSPSIEAVTFSIRPIVVVDDEVWVHNFNTCTMYVDFHAVGFCDGCGFRRDSRDVPHPITVGTWHRQAKSLMCVCKPEFLREPERSYRVKKYVALHFDRITSEVSGPAVRVRFFCRCVRQS